MYKEYMLLFDVRLYCFIVLASVFCVGYVHAETNNTTIDIKTLIEDSVAAENIVRTAIVEYTQDSITHRAPIVPPEILNVSPHIQQQMEANLDKVTSSRIWYSREAKQWKCCTKDMRNIDGLQGNDGSKVFHDRVLLDQEQLVGEEKEYMILFSPREMNSKAIIAPVPANARRSPPLFMAIVPAWVLKGAADLKCSDAACDGVPVIRVDMSLDQGRLSYYVDPKLERRFRKAEYRTATGQLYKEIVASDFVAEDDIIYPRQYEERRWNKGILIEEKSVKVKQARFNANIDSAVFNIVIPPTTAVSCMVGEKQGIYTTTEQIEINLDNASEAGVLIHKQSLKKSSQSDENAPPGDSERRDMATRRKRSSSRFEIPSSRPASQPTTMPHQSR